MIFDSDRLKLWVDAGALWSEPGNPFLMLDVQMLGHAEAPLLDFEGVLGELLKNNDNNEDTMLFMTQCVALSILWVFGLYEPLRKVRGSGVNFSSLSDLYHDVSVIRMPLAKHEVKSAPGFRAKHHYPVGIHNPGTGQVGWRAFDPNAKVLREFYRADMANRFLSARPVENSVMP